MKAKAAEVIEALKQIPAADLVAIVDGARAQAEAERLQLEAERVAAAARTAAAATTAMLVKQQRQQIANEAEERKRAIERLANQPKENAAFVGKLLAVSAKRAMADEAAQRATVDNPQQRATGNETGNLDD